MRNVENFQVLMSKSQHSEEKPYDGKVCGKTWPCVLTFFGNLTKGENAMNVRNHENDFARVCVRVCVYFLAFDLQ